MILCLNDSEEEIKEYFKNKLLNSGHTFEGRVEKILQKDFAVEREIPFFDKDENKGRFVDFGAKCYYPGSFDLKPTREPTLGVLHLIVECKCMENYAWLFYENMQAYNTMHGFDNVNWLAHTKKLPGKDFPLLPGIPIRDILYASKQVELFLPCGNRKTSHSNEKLKKLSPFIDSVYPLSKAVDHFVEIESKMYNDLFLKRHWKLYPHNQTFTAFQPLIVFGGRMYEVQSEGEDVKLNSIQMAQIKKTYYSSKYQINSGVIHITTLTGLPEYLEKLKKYFNINKEFLKFQKDSSKLFFS